MAEPIPVLAIHMAAVLGGLHCIRAPNYTQCSAGSTMLHISTTIKTPKVDDDEDMMAIGTTPQMAISQLVDV